jgi:hypothetical protein
VLLSIIIAVGVVLSGIGLTWIGIELTFRPPENDAAKKRARIFLGVFALVLIILTVWTTVRSELENRRLPQRLAEFVRNTTPPPVSARPSPTAPNPPTGLLAVVNTEKGGDWGGTAFTLAQSLDNFITSQGEPPVHKPDEGEIEFIIRSNAWYSSVMDQYKKQFAAQVINLVGLFVQAGVLDKEVNDLAKDPVNFIGVRTLARDLESGGRKYRAQQFGPN